MKIAILVLAVVVTIVYAAPNSDVIEEEVADRLDKLQEDLSIMKQIMMEIDESQVATQSIEKVQKAAKVKAQIFFGRFSGWKK